VSIKHVLRNRRANKMDKSHKKNVQTKITVHAWTQMADHKELEDNVRL